MSDVDESAFWLISGVVQGVGFRWFVKKAADELGVRGWVRNRHDGKVEVQAVGSPSVLHRMERRLWEGPGFSRVDNVEKMSKQLDIGTYKSFEII